MIHAEPKKQLLAFSANCAIKLVQLFLLLSMPAVVQAQYNYTTKNGTITITGYYGSGGAVDIPATINGLPVTTIATGAFMTRLSLTSVTIPHSVTNLGDGAFRECSHLTNVVISTNVTVIGAGVFANCFNLISVTMGNNVTLFGTNAFYGCNSLANVTLGNSVTNIGQGAFFGCHGLTRVVIPDSVTTIERDAFESCPNLTNVTIGNGVTSIGDFAFFACGLTSITIPASVTNVGDEAFAYMASLTAVYFKGNAPSPDGIQFFNSTNLSAVYYLPGTTGWGFAFGGRLAVLWNPQVQASGASFGVRTNRFGFDIAGSKNIPIVVEASADLANASWTALQTCTLTNGSIYFSDPQWTNYAARFYRIRSP